MRVLYLTDRLSCHSGSDLHLSQMMCDALDAGLEVDLAYGYDDRTASLPPGITGTSVKLLTARTASSTQMSRLGELIDSADVLHLVNVMNPLAIARAAATRRAVVTIQDHRVFCPAAGKTRPSGFRCTTVMSDEECASCLPDDHYRQRMITLTQERCAAMAGAHLLVLSSYMASELEQAGCSGVEVLPPWFAPPAEGPAVAGAGFLIAGRLVFHKAALDAWQAWGRAGSPQPLLVAGAGPLAGKLHGATQMGWLNQDRLHTTMRGCRALLFPSWWQEPFGIVGVQSLTAGTPVVVADAGGTTDWSAQGCLHVCPGDVEAMAVAIDRLGRNADLALGLGKQGQQWITQRYARSKIVQRLLSIYEARANQELPESSGTGAPDEDNGLATSPAGAGNTR